MLQAIKNFTRKLVYKENATSESLLSYLRAKGARIGKGVVVYAPNKTLIDKTAPWLLEIGDRVRITEGVKILMHDYSWSVLKSCGSEVHTPGEILGAQSAVIIGSNVFIGMNSIITRGVCIGDNVIIGAGSVVTKDCESNAVYAGNPAKRIMSIEEYYRKRKSLQLQEATALARRYRERFGEMPPKEVFSEYFMLFASKEDALRVGAFKAQMETSMNFNECEAFMDANTPMFDSYDAFLKALFTES